MPPTWTYCLHSIFLSDQTSCKVLQLSVLITSPSLTPQPTTTSSLLTAKPWTKQKQKTTLFQFISYLNAWRYPIFIYKDKNKFKIRGVILSVENKGRDFSPFHFLRVFTVKTLYIFSPLLEVSINPFEDLDRTFVRFMSQECHFRDLEAISLEYKHKRWYHSCLPVSGGGKEPNFGGGRCLASSYKTMPWNKDTRSFLSFG